MNLVRRCLFWVCLPFMIPQALILRRRAPRFPEARGPFCGQMGNGGLPLSLFGIGDSIIAGVGVERAAEALTGCVAAGIVDRIPCEVSWTSLGRTGFTAGQILRDLAPKLPSQPQNILLLSTGVNDVTHLRSTRTWSRNLGLLLDCLRSHSPAAVIAMAGVPPLHAFPLLPQPLRSVIGLRAKLFDQIAEKLIAGREKTLYVPLRFDPLPEKFSPDGYHPAARTYAEIGGMMADTIVDHGLDCV